MTFRSTVPASGFNVARERTPLSSGYVAGGEQGEFAGACWSAFLNWRFWLLAAVMGCGAVGWVAVFAVMVGG